LLFCSEPVGDLTRLFTGVTVLRLFYLPVRACIGSFSSFQPVRGGLGGGWLTLHYSCNDSAVVSAITDDDPHATGMKQEEAVQQSLIIPINA